MVLRFSSAGPKCDRGGVLISLVLAAALAAVPVAVAVLVGAAAVVPCARVDAAFGCRVISGMNYESMKHFDPNLSSDPGCQLLDPGSWSRLRGIQEAVPLDHSTGIFRYLVIMTGQCLVD